MSIESALERVGAIQQAIANPAMLVGANGAITGGTEAPAAAATATAVVGGGPALSASTQVAGAESPFAAALRQASGGLASASPIVTAAESQLGQSEQPPGSNESPAIAEYRGATSGAVPGAPWCAYFVSWAARQAGEPIGLSGEGLGSVSAIWSWAQSAGRAIPNSAGVQPKPGDLIVFGAEHVGIVKEVLPSGQIQTIEGNYQNKVSLNVRSASEATGYVSLS